MQIDNLSRQAIDGQTDQCTSYIIIFFKYVRDHKLKVRKRQGEINLQYMYQLMILHCNTKILLVTIHTVHGQKEKQYYERIFSTYHPAVPSLCLWNYYYCPLTNE